jgi:hypothetical protein
MENQNLDLIEPRGVLGREVEGDAVTGIAQECLACRHRLEDAGYPLLPRSSLMPLRSATRRVSPSDMWVLRLSQTTCYRAVDAEANRFSRNDTKSASVRVSPMVPRTLLEATSNAAIRAFVPWRKYSNSRRSTCPG